MEVPKKVLKSRAFPNARIKCTSRAVDNVNEPVKLDNPSTQYKTRMLYTAHQLTKLKVVYKLVVWSKQAKESHLDTPCESVFKES